MDFLSKASGHPQKMRLGFSSTLYAGKMRFVSGEEKEFSPRPGKRLN
jgi:hypothetical protein